MLNVESFNCLIVERRTMKKPDPGTRNSEHVNFFNFFNFYNFYNFSNFYNFLTTNY